MSCTKVFEKPDISFRAFFRDKWAAFLRENYANTEEVAVVYGVRHQTALNWWTGTNAPSGFAVARAFRLLPGQASQHLTREAA